MFYGIELITRKLQRQLQKCLSSHFLFNVLWLCNYRVRKDNETENVVWAQTCCIFICVCFLFVLFCCFCVLFFLWGYFFEDLWQFRNNKTCICNLRHGIWSYSWLPLLYHSYSWNYEYWQSKNVKFYSLYSQ